MPSQRGILAGLTGVLLATLVGTAGAAETFEITAKPGDISTVLGSQVTLPRTLSLVEVAAFKNRVRNDPDYPDREHVLNALMRCSSNPATACRLVAR